MTGKTHMLFGYVTSLYILPKLGYDPSIATTAAAALGSLIPDLDHPKAKLNQKILPIKNRFGKVLFYCGIGSFLIYRYGWAHQLIFTVAILLMVIGLSQHRSFTHSILGTGIIFFIVFFILKDMLPYTLLLSFLLGMASHLVGDFITIGGIELFYPFSNKKYKFILTISSAKLAEPLICIFFMYLIIYFYIGHNKSIHFIYDLIKKFTCFY
ncbi:metal-dependent hydrolase [Inediibacterium massiliense]|uniref:metal-dependent hydrolase n=1 Tax=Inediibacterium massiliense TaxID=1658111 RepID=UPI0006B460EF|nr:metal-dependent hydrolase [Inediibacterium massiliense]